MMRTKKVAILAIKTDEQRPKLVNPGETAFAGEPLLVNRSIEDASAVPNVWDVPIRQRRAASETIPPASA